MADVGNLGGAQVTKGCPPEALEVLEKSEEVEDVEQAEAAIVRENLRAMVNDPKYSDVRFFCQDGGKVFASRLLLVARSPMLQSLLSNGMAESRMDEIELPIVTTSAMIAAVEFLYTGCIVTQELTWASAFKIIGASRYLLLDNLRDYVLTFLENALDSEAEMKGEFAAWCLTELAESVSSGGKHLLQNTLCARVVRALVQKIHTNVDPYPRLTNNLSLCAFNLYLDVTESVHGTTKVSFREYLRLRCILLWACTKFSPMIEGEIQKYLPDEKWLREHNWDTLDALDSSNILAASFREMALPDDSRSQIGKWIETLEQGWSSAKLDCVHAMLLSKVVEPLGVIPNSLMLSAFRTQAVNAGNRNLMTWDKGDHEDVEILESGTVLRVAANPAKTECTIVHNSMLINHGLCEWDLIIEGPGSDLGIGLTEKKQSKFSSCSDSGLWIRLLENSGYLYFLTTQGASVLERKVKKRKYCSPFRRAQRYEVRVRVDMALRTCAFTIDGKEYPTGWSNLPDEVYPCIAIGVSEVPVTVRFKLASDPDFV